MKPYFVFVVVCVCSSLIGCAQIHQPSTPKDRVAHFCDPVCTHNSIGPYHNTYDYDSDRVDF